MRQMTSLSLENRGDLFNRFKLQLNIARNVTMGKYYLYACRILSKFPCWI